MSDPVERPLFSEGQILGADDLTASLEYGRGQMARHERFLHLWGIAEGLDLVEQPTQAGLQVLLKQGVAIDGAGREVVVASDLLLSQADFSSSNVVTNDPSAWYPVFLTGLDGDAPRRGLLTGACANGAPTRKVESYQVRFGRPGTARDLDLQSPPPGVTDVRAP